MYVLLGFLHPEAENETRALCADHLFGHSVSGLQSEGTENETQKEGKPIQE